MKIMIKALIIFCLISSAFAGFGRSGSSGGRSYSSSGYSRSYSAPRSYYTPQRTVVYRNTTNVVHSSSGGGGIHPLVAGMAGYMVGSALANNHPQYATPAPQVVYVNGQPQTQQIVQPQDQPQIIQAPAVQQYYPDQHGFIFYFILILLLLAGIAFVLHVFVIERERHE
jgi:hypothetical protein